MHRIQTFVPLAQVPSATLNAMQDNAAPGIGYLVWRDTLQCTDGATIRIGAIHRLLLGGEEYSASSESTFTPTVSADTWYYVYAYISSSTLTFEASTTVPNADLVFKTSTTTHRYLGCFLTTSSGTIIPFTKTRGKHVWRLSAGAGVSSFQTSPGSNSTILAPLTLVSTPGYSAANLVPPHARNVDLKLDVTNSDTAAQQIIVLSESDTVEALTVPVGANPGRSTLIVTMPLESTQTLQYRSTNANATLFPFVIGFQE